MKHFDNGIISFDYPDEYSRDMNSKYKELNIIASFKMESSYSLSSAFAVFEGEFVSDKIPDSKFIEAFGDDIGNKIVNINRYFFGKKERIIIQTENKRTGNIYYRCNIPELGFYVMFIVFNGKEYLFDKEFICAVVNSLEKSSQKQSHNEQVKICHVCGSKNPQDSMFCMECGTQIFIQGVQFCMHCGAEIVPGAKFCLNCGKLIE